MLHAADRARCCLCVVGPSRLFLMGQSSSSSSAPILFRPVSQCAVERMADVEICSVLHFLSVIGIIRVARCSKRLNHAASSSFAFRYCRPVEVHYPTSVAEEWRQLKSMSPSQLLARAGIGSRHSPSPFVLRQIPWRMLLTEDILTFPYSPTPAALSSFAAQRGTLRELVTAHLFPDRSKEDSWRIMLLLPCMEQLQIVKILTEDPGYFGKANEKLFRALALLPNMHTLALRLTPDSLGFGELTAAPCLTRLDVNDSFRTASTSRLPVLATFPHLLHLSVLRPSLYGASWVQFFSTPLAARLESLSLNLIAPPRNAAEAAAREYSAIANMTSLRELRLRRIDDVVSIIPHLASLPALQLFVLVLRGSTTERPITELPPPVFATLLQSSVSRDLRCVVRVVQVVDIEPLKKDAKPIEVALSEHTEAIVSSHIVSCALRFRDEVINARLAVEIIQTKAETDD